MTTAVVAPHTFAKGVGKLAGKGLTLLAKKAGLKEAAKLAGFVVTRSAAPTSSTDVPLCGHALLLQPGLRLSARL